MSTADEYTPATFDVRADYVRDHTRNFDSYMVGRSLTSEQELYGARFDRWLEGERARARTEITPTQANNVLAVFMHQMDLRNWPTSADEVARAQQATLDHFQRMTDHTNRSE